jgi:hypothetical protein
MTLLYYKYVISKKLRWKYISDWQCGR